MAGTSINGLAIVLKELRWSYAKLIAALAGRPPSTGSSSPRPGA